MQSTNQLRMNLAQIAAIRYVSFCFSGDRFFEAIFVHHGFYFPKWVRINLQQGVDGRAESFPSLGCHVFLREVGFKTQIGKDRGGTSAVYRGLKTLRSASTAFSPLPTLSLSVTSPKVTRTQHSTPHRTIKE